MKKLKDLASKCIRKGYTTPGRKWYSFPKYFYYKEYTLSFYAMDMNWESMRIKLSKGVEIIKVFKKGKILKLNKTVSSRNYKNIITKICRIIKPINNYFLRNLGISQTYKNKDFYTWDRLTNKKVCNPYSKETLVENKMINGKYVEKKD